MVLVLLMSDTQNFVQSPTANAKLVEISEETSLRGVKVEFFSRPAVEPVLHLLDVRVRKAVKIRLFREVFPYEPVRVLDASLLPRGIGVREIDGDLVAPLTCQPFRDVQMRGELAAVVRGDCPDESPVREQQPDHGPCRGDGLAPLAEPLHQDEVRGAFRQREDGMAVRVHDSVHLPVPEASAVGLRRTLVYARAAGDVGSPGRALPLHAALVSQLMGHVCGQPPRRVGVDMVVDGLPADAYALLAQHAGYLAR